MCYETLKQVQGDKKQTFARASTVNSSSFINIFPLCSLWLIALFGLRRKVASGFCMSLCRQVWRKI